MEKEMNSLEKRFEGSMDRFWMSLFLMIIVIIAMFCRIFDLIDLGDFLIIVMLSLGFMFIIYSLGKLNEKG